MPKVHLMVRLVQVVTVLFVLLGCSWFLYSPFYSKLIVAGLNYFVPVDVNQVAAESQRQAALSEHDNLGGFKFMDRSSGLFKTDRASVT